MNSMTQDKKFNLIEDKDVLREIYPVNTTHRNICVTEMTTLRVSFLDLSDD